MKAKQLGLFLIAVAAVFLSGCGTFQLNASDLLMPPKLTDEQAAIYAALEEAVGQDIHYKYPQNGDYRSAFLFSDIDRDGEEEVLVFYISAADETQTVRINLLDRAPNGEWTSVCDVAGRGTDVDEAGIYEMSAEGSFHLLVSWVESPGLEKVVTVLSFQQSRLVTVFETGCSVYQVMDINSDGLDEIILLSKSDYNVEPAARLVREVNGELSITSQILMCPNTGDYVNLVPGQVEPGKPALFIDEQRGADGYSTEVLVFENGRLGNLIYNASENLLSSTFRPATLPSQDADLDGVLEIPYTEQLPGYVMAMESEATELVVWQEFRSGQLVKDFSSVINMNERYYFIVPDDWIGRMTVYSYHSSSEWIFAEYDPDVSAERRIIMTIKAVTQGESLSDEDLVRYVNVGERGNMSYYVHIPDPPAAGEDDTEQEPITISIMQFLERFVIY